MVVVVVLADRLDLRSQLDPEALRAAGASPSPGLIVLLAITWLAMMGGSLSAIAAGAVLFGWIGGTWVSLLGALFAHSTWFWLARTSLREFVQGRAGPRTRWLIGVIERGGVGLVIAWNLLGGPGGPFLVAAALSRMPYRVFVLGILSITPRALLTALITDTLLRWELAAIPAERWLLLVAVGVPMVIAYGALLVLRPELRPWRFGKDDPAEFSPVDDPDVDDPDADDPDV